MKCLWTVDHAKHGKGPVVFAWHPESTYLATSGVNKVVYVIDRNGEVVSETALSGQGTGVVSDMQWDKDGEVLAILQQGSGIVPLWEAHSRKTTMLDTGMKDVSFIRWSRTGPQLAVGTAKGNLLIYNKQTLKKFPVLGKHTRKITCGAWNLDNKLALGSDDKYVTVSNAEGDTLNSLMARHECVEMAFSEMKGDKKATERENTVSVNMGRKTILLYDISESAKNQKPVEVAFQAKYGQIVTYRWFGDGYLVIGFSSGYLVVISTHMKEIGQELFSHNFHSSGLADLAVSGVLNRAATCGDNSVRIIDMKDWKEIKSDRTVLESELGQLDRMHFSGDGQILSVSTKTGTVYNFLARIPMLTSRYETRILYLSSLRELAVVDPVNGDISTPLARIGISMEPTFVALGRNHVAVGGNNRAWFYEASEESKEVNQREYIGSIQEIHLNATVAAVLSRGCVNVHMIDGSVAGADDVKMFPERDDSRNATCAALTDDFLVFGTGSGGIHYVHLEDWHGVNEYRHETGIRRLHVNATATRVVFVDDGQKAFVYNPTNDESIEISQFPGGPTTVLWDNKDWGVFVAAEASEVRTYVYAPTTMHGPKVTMVGKTELPYGYKPILLNNGHLVCQINSGALETVLLTTHSALINVTTMHMDRQTAFQQALTINRLKTAWELAYAMNEPILFKKLHEVALINLDVDIAIRANRMLGDIGLVMELKRLEFVEDKNQLAGGIAMLLGNYSEAQDLYLASHEPLAALDMRRDLLQWDAALQLAKTLAPDQIPFISRQYAQQQEFQGEYSAALQMYEKGLTNMEEHREHDAACNRGIARVSLRLGQIKRGKDLAIASGDEALCRECARILEGMKQLPDAAMLYEKGGMFDPAAAIYISLKNFGAAGPLMAKIKTPKLHVLYAKAKEAEGKYHDAATSYEFAKDMDSVVRLCLEHLDAPERAFEIVRQTGSIEGAQLVARFCQRAGDYRAAVEFLIKAKLREDAFELARSHDEMDTYANLIEKDGGSNDDFLVIAQHFENKGQPGKAGEYYARAGQFHRALRFFMDGGEEHIQDAIDVVGKARNDMLTHQLIDYLMGETGNNVPKDPKYIFQLYMALGNFVQAGRTAIIIARQEQELGNYLAAHQILLDTSRELTTRAIAVPNEMSRALMLLHSYILVKILVKMGDHLSGARMLIRVAKSISKFPMHVVPILTSTVIECKRSDLKRSAFEYASMLMRPEYRHQVHEQYVRKIENIVRKEKDNRGEPDEDCSLCPYCSYDLPNSQLDCPACKNHIPFCIATGRHMVRSNWTVCPSCAFPALQSMFGPVLDVNGRKCPMCASVVAENPPIMDPTPFLSKPSEGDGEEKE